MNYHSTFLKITYVFLIMLTTYFFPLLQLNAQVPAEEFKITPTCSDTNVHPSEKEKHKSLITDKKGKEEFFIYGNASLGYKIEYPMDWQGIQTHCLLEGTGIIQASSIINFMSTPNSSKNGLLGITVADYSPGLSIDEFVKVYSDDFGSMIESKEIIMLDGKPAAKIYH